MDRWINRLSNIAVVGVALVMAAYVVKGRADRPRSSPRYQIGERVETEGLGQLPALVIATRSNCRFCIASLPFYRTLQSDRVLWIAVGETTDANAAYLRGQQVDARRVQSLDASRLRRIGGTPTVMMVGADGRIANAWFGKLDARQEDEVRALLRTLN